MITGRFRTVLLLAVYSHRSHLILFAQKSVVPCSCLVIQTIKFTDKFYYETIFFQDEINVETGHVNFTDLVIHKYLHFYIFHHNLFYYRFPCCISLSHDAPHIFSKHRNCCLEVLIGFIFSLFWFSSEV